MADRTSFRRRSLDPTARLLQSVDDVVLNAGSGGDTIRADEDGGGVKWQYVKLAYGADGTQTIASSANPVPVENAGNTISTNNSTTSTLTANQNTVTDLGFAGDDVSEYAAVSVTIYSDQASATNGMTFQFSTDNTNWDDTYTFTLSAGTTRRFQFPVTAQYFRVNYTNGGTGQTAFRVQTILNKHNILTSIHRLADDMSPDRSAQVVKSVLYAQAAGTGNFTAVDTTAGGNLKVSVEEGVNTPSDAYATPTDALNVAAINMVYNGATWDFVREGGENGSILVDLGANNDVTVAGVSTAANQTTIIGYVDGIEALLTTIDADTSSMATDLGTLAGAVAAGQMQVDIVADGAGLLTTAAHDAAFGTAGTADAQVRSVQGIASMTPLLVDATGQGNVPVSGTVTANLGATDNAVLDQIEVNTSYGDNTGNGTAAGALRVTVASDSTGSLAVDLGNNNDVTVTGGNAHNGTTLGNPVLGGARATNSVEGITQVADADLTHIQADLNGVLLTRNATTLEELLSTSQSVTTTTSTAATNFGVGGAGIHNYITSVTVMNSSATDTRLTLQAGSGGSAIWVFPNPAGGGATHNFNPPLKQPTDNQALYFASADAATTVYVSICGFQAQG